MSDQHPELSRDSAQNDQDLQGSAESPIPSQPPPHTYHRVHSIPLPSDINMLNNELNLPSSPDGSESDASNFTQLPDIPWPDTPWPAYAFAIRPPSMEPSMLTSPAKPQQQSPFTPSMFRPSQPYYVPTTLRMPHASPAEPNPSPDGRLTPIPPSNDSGSTISAKSTHSMADESPLYARRNNTVRRTLPPAPPTYTPVDPQLFGAKGVPEIGMFSTKAPSCKLTKSAPSPRLPTPFGAGPSPKLERTQSIGLDFDPFSGPDGISNGPLGMWPTAFLARPGTAQGPVTAQGISPAPAPMPQHPFLAVINEINKKNAPKPITMHDLTQFDPVIGKFLVDIDVNSLLRSSLPSALPPSSSTPDTAVGFDMATSPLKTDIDRGREIGMRMTGQTGIGHPSGPLYQSGTAADPMNLTSENSPFGERGTLHWGHARHLRMASQPVQQTFHNLHHTSISHGVRMEQVEKGKESKEGMRGGKGGREGEVGVDGDVAVREDGNGDADADADGSGGGTMPPVMSAVSITPDNGNDGNADPLQAPEELTMSEERATLEYEWRSLVEQHSRVSVERWAGNPGEESWS